MKMIDHNHFICHLILGTFTEYPKVNYSPKVFRIAFWGSHFKAESDTTFYES